MGRFAKSRFAALIRVPLQKRPPCDPLDSSHNKPLPDTSLAVCAPCLRRNEPFQQVNTINFTGQLVAGDLGRESCCGRRDGHAGRSGLPHKHNLRRGQAVGRVCEVAEGALQFQGFGGEGAEGRAEKLKLGKQKNEIARRRARRSAAPSCPG